MRDPQHHVSPNLKRHQDAEHRHAVHERVGPIDRIQDPPVRRIAVVLTELLTEDRVIREPPRDQPAEHTLGATVGLGHGRCICLTIHSNASLEVRQGRLPRQPRRLDRKIQQRPRLYHSGHPSASRRPPDWSQPPIAHRPAGWRHSSTRVFPVSPAFPLTSRPTPGIPVGTLSLRRFARAVEAPRGGSCGASDDPAEVDRRTGTCDHARLDATEDFAR